jgi:hypothetical protein
MDEKPLSFEKRKELRRLYRMKHGHFPENEKSKLYCRVCKKEFEEKWNGIVGIKKELLGKFTTKE